MLYMAPIDTVPEAGGAVVYVDVADITPNHSGGGTGNSSSFSFTDQGSQTFIVGVYSGTTGFPNTITFDGSAPGSGGVTQLAAAEPVSGRHFRWYEITGVTGGSIAFAWSHSASLTVRAICFQLVGYDTSAVLDSDTALIGGSGTTQTTLSLDKAADAATLVLGSGYHTIVSGAVQEYSSGVSLVAGVIRSDAAQTPASIVLGLTTAQSNRGGSAISVARA